MQLALESSKRGATTAGLSPTCSPQKRICLGLSPKKKKIMGADTPGGVTHGLTLRGSQLNWAILNGHKIIENRGWSLQPGWCVRICMCACTYVCVCVVIVYAHMHAGMRCTRRVTRPAWSNARA